MRNTHLHPGGSATTETNVPLSVQVKLKICVGCNEPRKIWKSHGRDKYCQMCWKIHLQQNPDEAPPPKKPTDAALRRADEDLEYLKLRKIFLARPENACCKGNLPGCTGTRFLTVQHLRGRGEYYLVMSTWITLCLNCHRWVNENPREAEALGLAEKRLIKYPPPDAAEAA